MALCHREALALAWSVLALEGLHGQHNERVFLGRMRAAEIFKAFSSFGKFGSTTKCTTMSFSKNECQLMDDAERTRQAPTPLNHEISHPSHIDHGKDCNNHVGRAGRDRTCDKGMSIASKR